MGPSRRDVQRIAEGQTTKEIAADLWLGVKTVASDQPDAEAGHS